MNKPVLAIDIDDVLIPTVKLVADALGGQFGVVVDPYATRDHGLRDELALRSGQSFKTVSEAMHGYLLSQEFTHAALEPGAVASLELLSRHYKIMTITARSPEFQEPTKLWVAEYFPNIITESYFPNNVAMNHGEQFGAVDKVAHLKECGAKWLIDDKLDHLIPLSGTDIKGLLFGDLPWSRDKTLPPGIKRVLNWDEVLDVLLPS